MILLSCSACNITRQWLPNEVITTLEKSNTAQLPIVIQEQGTLADGMIIKDITIDKVVYCNSASAYLSTTWTVVQTFPSWCDHTPKAFKEVLIPVDLSYQGPELHWITYWSKGRLFIENQLY